MDVFLQRNTATAARDGYYVGFSATELQLRVYGSAGATNSAAANSSLTKHQDGRWRHYAITFDDATDVILTYLNGVLINRVLNTRDMTATAGCSTTLGGAGINGLTAYSLFDLQVFPDVVLTPDQIPLLMNPQISVPNCKGRYGGLQFTNPGSGGLVIDESGSGNHLTASGGSTVLNDAEPPFRPTYQ